MTARKTGQPMQGQQDDQSQLAREYQLRFEQHADYRALVWKELCNRYFQKLIREDAVVLDLGCGWGEFINTIRAAKKYAMDLNPESPKYLNPDVEFLHQDCSMPWPLAEESLDVIFTSNFFEHLPSKEHLMRTVKEARRCLKLGGFLICMGPNIRYVNGAYWDFFDHYLPLTDAALEELAQIVGFQRIQVIKRFLPYTMAHGWRPPVGLVRIYLSLPFLWKFFGRQFLVVAQK
jgi:SAM-dependent methyltransferase